MESNDDYPPCGAGVTTNCTIYYDPELPVPIWHRNMELIFVCVTMGLTIIIIVSRTWYRLRSSRRLRADDKWMVAAGIVVVFPHTVSQLGTIAYGDGLHYDNVPDAWHKSEFLFSRGFFAYFLVCAFIKISVCLLLLEMLPHIFIKLRRFAYVLCAASMGLGIAEALVWLFQCLPVASNFIWTVWNDTCIDIDYARYAWSGLSILIDFGIMFIPYAIIRQVQLDNYKKKILMMVFAASFLGTIACAIGIYGIWANRIELSDDFPYNTTPFAITNDMEILMYTLGASVPVLSRTIIKKFSSRLPQSLPVFNASWVRQPAKQEPAHRVSGRPTSAASAWSESSIDSLGKNGADWEIEALEHR